MAEVVTKTELARKLGVNPAAVSNYIKRRKLTAPALRADGKVDLDLAMRQLGSGSVDAARSAGQARQTGGGLADGDGVAAWTPTSQVNFQHARARALSATIDAELKRRELNALRGRYTLAAQAEAEWGKALADFLTEVEQSFADLNYQLAGLDDRERMLAIRRWWRKLRADSAATNQATAEREPEFVEDTAA